MMYSQPRDVARADGQAGRAFSLYVAAKAEAGADVIQVFDSWVGALSPADYEEFVAPYSARILAAVDVPTIHFGTGTATLLSSLARAGRRRDRPRLAHPARPRLGRSRRRPRRAGQPRSRCSCSGRGSGSRPRRSTILRRAGGRPGHVFNLGHGVLPETDPVVLGRLRELVHERRSGGSRMSAAVVLMAYGSPERLDDVPAYYARHPRRPADRAGAPRGSRRALPQARDRGRARR